MSRAPRPAGLLRSQRRRAWWLLAALAVALVAWDLSGLDLMLTRLVGTPAGFPARHAWWAERLLHDGARVLAALLWVLLLMSSLLERPAPARARAPTRRQRRLALAGVALAWLLVPAFKRVSRTSCPWELAEFGGVAHPVSHWLWTVADGGSGHCFPSGHATTAFAFLVLVPLWWPHRRRAAQALLLVVLGSGLLLSGVQLLRGAHHLSHSLWSGWACGLFALLWERSYASTRSE